MSRQSISDSPGGGLDGAESAITFTPATAIATTGQVMSSEIVVPLGAVAVIIRLYDSSALGGTISNILLQGKMVDNATGWATDGAQPLPCIFSYASESLSGSPFALSDGGAAFLIYALGDSSGGVIYQGAALVPKKIRFRLDNTSAFAVTPVATYSFIF